MWLSPMNSLWKDKFLVDLQPPRDGLDKPSAWPSSALKAITTTRQGHDEGKLTSLPRLSRVVVTWDYISCPLEALHNPSKSRFRNYKLGFQPVVVGQLRCFYMEIWYWKGVPTGIWHFAYYYVLRWSTTLLLRETLLPPVRFPEW